MIKLSLRECASKVRLTPGSYSVYILGGFYVKADNGFGMKVLNGSTKKGTVIEKHSFKLRDHIQGRRAVKYFSFKIESSGEYDISFYGFEDIVVKKSMLHIQRLFQEPVELREIEISIVRNHS